MADHCSFCDTRRPSGGTNHLVLNGGEFWIEFCGPCGARETLHNAETGETLTVQVLFDRAERESKRDDSLTPRIDAREFYDEPQGWPGDGSGVDDFADYNQNEANDYLNE